MQWLRSDPLLQSISHLIIDEIHERDILSDFLITILKDILPQRQDLKVILMSATLNAEKFSKYFNNCRMLNIPGYTHEVEEFYLEDVLEQLDFTYPASRERVRSDKPWHKHTRKGKEMAAKEYDFQDFIGPFLRDLERRNFSRRTIENLSKACHEDINHDLIASLIAHIHKTKGDGAILVFVPGWKDISKVHDQTNALLRTSSKKYKIYPLHSLMPTVNQKEIFNIPPLGTRKIVVATNIAGKTY